ncbi:MAG TPA: pyridoxamine 5'-phosphate oxidase family protein, partial [Actinomycetota bacterium]|nr:pyridoxamine 5'-phosphate oxidase family protein [Actinomycetota bacterium]
MVDPIGELMRLPEGYGAPTRTLEWAHIRRKLETAPVYWVASTRRDGRPHLVPRDGVWLDEALWYGGGESTVHNRNVRRDPRVVASVGQGMEAVIVEGETHPARADEETARRLAVLSGDVVPEALAECVHGCVPAERAVGPVVIVEVQEPAIGDPALLLGR